LSDESLLKKFYKVFFKNRIDSLDTNVFKLLLFIGIAPFSVHISDVKAFCDAFDFDFEDATKTLEDYLLIFRTKPAYYINVPFELDLYEKEFPQKHFEYFANGRNEDDFPYYYNCENAKPLVRALINEALIQRFHKDWGYYVTNPLRRIIRYLDKNNDYYKQVVKWAYGYFSDLTNKNDSPSVELACAYFNIENNKFLDEKNYVDVNFEKLAYLCSKGSSMQNEDLLYYSILLNRRIPMVMTDKIFKHNLLFCYNHVLNFSGIYYTQVKDKDEADDDVFHFQDTVKC
jgi:hypothetical protein